LRVPRLKDHAIITTLKNALEIARQSDQAEPSDAPESDAGGHQGKPIGDWLDAWAVIDNFNGFLREIGRPERIFRLTTAPGRLSHYPRSIQRLFRG
jgi:hypothetical protein